MENKTKIDLNSCKNQNIKQKFVSIHVYLNMLLWVEDYQQNNECFFEDFENLQKDFGEVKIFGEYHEVTREGLEDWEQDQKESNDLYLEDGTIGEGTYERNEALIDAAIDAIEEQCNEYEEIYEYWAISEYLYEKLKEKGYCVAEINNTYIWGRCTTGQAILLDYSISKICQDMEILEGQANEWRA